MADPIPADPSREYIDMGLINKVEDRHKSNVEKWGHQHPETLMPVLMEEIGEVSKSYLQSYYGYEDCDIQDFREEIIDSMAVLVELYQNLDYWDYERGED